MKIEITQKDKDLLLKDLSNRLPYSVKIHEDIQGDFTLIGLVNDRVITTCEVDGCHNNFPIEIIKPYLFPFSNMTEEQEKECQQIKHSYYYDDDSFVLFDWYNKNHFDYRGLIEKGLAIDATNKNIY